MPDGRLCKENNVPHAIRGYELQHRSALKLIAATSWEQVADAYFKGSVIALENAVDDRDPENGLGTFAGWLRLMDNGRFADADALLVRRLGAAAPRARSARARASAPARCR